MVISEVASRYSGENTGLEAKTYSESWWYFVFGSRLWLHYTRSSSLRVFKSYCFTHVQPFGQMRSATHLQIDTIENKVAVACIFNHSAKLTGFVNCEQQQLDI